MWVEVILEMRVMAFADVVGLTFVGVSVEKIMIFVNIVVVVDEIVCEFNVFGLCVVVFYVDMVLYECVMCLKDFVDGVITALVCMDSAVRGVDILGVMYVV